MALPAHPLRRWPMLGAPATLALALVLFLAFFALRVSDANVGDAEATLFVIPIAVIALRFGVRGGLGGALLAFALVLAWGYRNHVDLALGGYLTRGAAFFVLGALFGSFVDHRRRLEAEILRHYDASIDLLATADRSGRFIRVNRAWQRTLGHSPEAMHSRPFIEFVHPDDRDATIAEAAALARGSHESVGFRNRCRAADGSYRWLEWSASASESDGVIHVVARDISAKHEAEQQLADNAKWLETKVTERTLELDDARSETLHRLAIAAEYRDDETFEHADRVGANAADVAAALGLGAEDVKLLREAAPLHDVGKLAIPDGILLKPGRLDPQEWELMKTHAELGADLLSGSSSPVLQMAAVIAATHHERFDGTGYPKGLAGDAIPLVGRIVAVADVFDALTHDRPYKKATPEDGAIAEIRRVAGSQLDPRVVEVFLARLGDLASTEHHKRAAHAASARRAARTGPTLRPSRPAQYA
jgi:PAS domain S-box-containing protein